LQFSVTSIYNFQGEGIVYREKRGNERRWEEGRGERERG
jgi:hypothetical protein